MNRYKLSKAGISASEGIGRFGGSVEQYERLLMEFPAEPHFDDMCKAVEQKDWQAAFSAAHALKGVAGNLSMKKLYADLAPLVEELRGGRAEHAEAMLKPVRADYAEILTVLKAMP